MARYALPPDETEARSLQLVDRAIDAARWPGAEREIVRRLVYAAGDAAIADLVRIHPSALSAGTAALRGGCPIIVDVRMVEVALDRVSASSLGCQVHCAIDAPAVIEEAKASGLSRAAVAIRSLATHLEEALVVVGTAPTALLALLDLLDAGGPAPSLIVGTPVGFVAAAQAKVELTARRVPYITILGTRGGAALGATAANALLQLAVSGDPP